MNELKDFYLQVDTVDRIWLSIATVCICAMAGFWVSWLISTLLNGFVNLVNGHPQPTNTTFALERLLTTKFEEFRVGFEAFKGQLERGTVATEEYRERLESLLTQIKDKSQQDCDESPTTIEDVVEAELETIADLLKNESLDSEEYAAIHKTLLDKIEYENNHAQSADTQSAHNR